MGFPKALLRYRDETFLDTLIGLFAAALRARDRGARRARRPHSRRRRCGPPPSSINPDYQRGQTSSMQCGLRAVPARRRRRPLHPGGPPGRRAGHARCAAAPLPRPWSACRATRAAAATPSGFAANSSPSSSQLPENGAARDIVRSSRRRDRVPRRGRPRHPRRYRRPRGLQPPHRSRCYEAPPRPAVQDPRRAARSCSSIAGFAAPAFTADQYGRRLQTSLERALGRRVEIGKVHFNLFKGPGFSVDNVTIYEDPAIGMEPVVYIQEPGSMEVVPSIWSLLGGQIRDRLHPPRWSQHQSHQIGPGVRVGPLEFCLDRQSLGDSHRPRHPRARQPHSLQVRRHQERLLPHRDRSRRLPVRLQRRLEDRLFRQARAHRPPRARPGIVHA